MRKLSKYILVEAFSKMINELIEANTSDKLINKWLLKYDNIVYSIEYYLKLIEQKSSHAK